MTDLRAEANRLRDLAEAERVERAARKERVDLIESRVRAQRNVIVRMVDAEFAEHLNALCQKTREAIVAHEEAAVAAGRAALAAMDDPRRVEWATPKYERTPKPTGRTGQYEVWTRESRCPDNLSGYSVPCAGEIVLRINKSDGTPSARFVRRPWSIGEPGDPVGWRRVAKEQKS